MKCLCVCQYGHCRSVALCRVLHAAGHQAVPVGWMTSPSAIRLLADWADKIFVLESGYIGKVPQSFTNKVVVMDVGPDKWSNPYNHELYSLLERMVIDFFKDQDKK